MSSHEMNFRKRDAEKEAEQRRSAVPRWNAFSLMLSSVLGTGQVENDEFPPFRCRVLLSKRLFLFFFSFASFSSEIFNVSFIWFIRIPRFQSGTRCDIFHDTSMLKENVKRCERSVLFFCINSPYISLFNESSHSRTMIQCFVEMRLQFLQVLGDVYNTN